MSSKSSTVAVLALGSFLASLSMADASEVYTYTGNFFTTSVASPGANAAIFAGQDVSGEFTLGAALGANFNGVITPTQFSFSGGPFTLTNLNSTNDSFDIQTSNTGAIIDWTILASISNAYANITVATSSSGDLTSSLGPTTFISASNGFAPGTWSASDPPSATPLPAALPLFAGGLGALAMLGWRRKRRAAEVRRQHG
jgi:hypothetical protein